jgi:uncharacterized protein (TIGR00266 family)
MQIEIGYRPAHSMARVVLDHGESIIAEAGAMVGKSTNVQMQTQASGGGIMGGLKAMFAGESFFRNTFTSNGPGEVLLAHALCGDMAVLDMTPQGYFLSSSAFIAASPQVQIETKVGGMKGFLRGGGLFMMKATSAAPGQLLVGAFGGVQELVCNGDMVIDNGHLVAWDATLDYKMGKSGAGWIASMLSGEGLVCHFSGQGRIWIQTRNPPAYGKTLGKMLPPQTN